jgi:hypothetical protein
VNYDGIVDLYRRRQDEVFLESLSRRVALATAVGDLLLPLPSLTWLGWCGF